METVIARTQSEVDTNEAVRSAVSALQSGEVVALPTETVYGLAADAFSPAAVEKIFAAKDRPSFDPLIVHVHHKDAIRDVAEIPEEIKKAVVQLIETFWPGPLTLVLPKKPAVSKAVTGGLDTVAVRQCDHPVFHRIIRNFGGPLAAPSANLFGRMSPTSAQAVMDQLEGRIPLIIDGGACSRGLESTILKIEPGEKKPLFTVLRPGPITEVELKKFGKVVFAERNAEVEDSSPEAPGMLENHYAPNKPLRLLTSPGDFSPENGKRYALLSYRGQAKDGYLESYEWDHISVLSPGSGRVAEAGTRFFHVLRQLDAMEEIDEIISEPMPDRGVGKALLEKLKKAAVKG
ncbi:MAG: L-threonylcarbamoyladenylate synthase [Verrucomicrobiales bacterium]|nr:L-threonylcarbamoyladenylate synthase [Verrucomicrobiales bacterium]